MSFKDFLGIKSPSAEIQKYAEEVLLPNLFAGFKHGLRMARNCRCAIVIVQPPQLKYWDVKASPVYRDESYESYQMRKWLSQVPHGGIVGNSAVLIVYNKTHPELSEMIVQGI